MCIVGGGSDFYLYWGLMVDIFLWYIDEKEKMLC